MEAKTSAPTLHLRMAIALSTLKRMEKMIKTVQTWLQGGTGGKVHYTIKGSLEKSRKLSLSAGARRAVEITAAIYIYII